MGALSWVGGTGAGWVNGGTTISSPNTPTDIADNDGLFAFVHTTTNTTITPPAGWTEVTNVGATAGAGYSKLYVFRKDTVTSGDADTSYTFTAGASVQLSLAYACVRADMGIVRVDAANTFAASDISTTDVTIGFEDTFATRDGSILLLVGGTYWGVAGSYSPFLDGVFGDEFAAEQWTGDQNPNLMAGARVDRTAGQGVGSLSFTWATGSVTNNGVVSVALLLSAPQIEDALTENVRTEDFVFPTQRAAASASDGVLATPAVAAFPRWGGVLADQILWTMAQAVVARTFGTVADSTALADTVRSAVGVTVSRTMTLTDTAQGAWSIRISDNLVLSRVAAAVARYGLSALDGVLHRDALNNVAAASASDTLSIAPITAELTRRPAVTADLLTLSEVLGHALVLRVTVTDTVDLTATEALRMIFRPALKDAVEIVAGYVAPDGSFTAWAVNTETTAVTEYSNYPFTSFARMGRRYIAAGPDGLYVLDGDTDAGAPIIADLKTGLMQFAGSRFAGVKTIYLGLRRGTTDEMYVKIIEGDDTTRTYRVLVRDRTTTKVQVGKGLRARYFALELVTTGQDFDLDTIEVVPLLNARRV
jgi:hypothetical protein